MKLILYTYFIIILLVFISCKTAKNYTTLTVTTSNKIITPIVLSTGNFFNNNSLYFIDKPSTINNYKLITGSLVSILKDTSFYIFEPDTINIQYNDTGIIVVSKNLKNKDYNSFYSDMQTILYPLHKEDVSFFNSKLDSITKDKIFIDNVLSNHDTIVEQILNKVLSDYNFSAITKKELKNFYIRTKKLVRDFFYCEPVIQSLNDSLKIDRLNYYLKRLNSQQVSIFSQFDILLMTNSIAYYFTNSSINKLRTKDDIEEYYLKMKKYFEKGTTAYNYLVTALVIQAKKNKLKLNTPILEDLLLQVKNNSFKKYILKKYSSKNSAIADRKYDKTLYNYYMQSKNLEEILKEYNEKPLLIDIWASWCLPCIKKLPELETYKSNNPNLNIVFICLDKSQDAWKLFLYEHNISNNNIHYRKNYYNKRNKILQEINEIPKYLLLMKNGELIVVDKIDTDILNNYLNNF